MAEKERKQELTPEESKDVVKKITTLSERELKEEVKRRSGDDNR